MKQLQKMKTLSMIFLTMLLMNSFVKAQAPQAISYQAVARNASGNVMPNKLMGLRFGIRDMSATGTLIYLEEQKQTTNALGLFSVNVGQGNLVFGYQPLSVINWQTGSKFLSVEIDTTGGTTYTLMGTQQLLSVPYALNAGNGVPVGTIVAFGGDASKVPDGWLLCNGAELSTNDPKYAALFAAIGNSWGTSAATKFNIPYTGGLFLRGISYNGQNDPDAATRRNYYTGGNTGDNVGSLQDDAFASHYHPRNNDGRLEIALTTLAGVYDLTNYGSATHLLAAQYSVTGSTGGNETRPKNVYVNYIIKY